MSVPRTEGPGRSWRPCVLHDFCCSVKTRLLGGVFACLAATVPLLPATADAFAPVEAAADAALVTVLRDTMVVRGRSLADRVFPAAPSVVTVVDLEAEQGGADLAELLARVAGLQVRRYGGIGAEAVASIRGSSGSQVLVLVDGLPLADAQHGAVDISQLPLERFGTAEIHRGLVPTGFGGIGAAGAVNLRTREGAEGPGVRLFTGSLGDVGGRVSYGASSADGRRRGLVLAHGRRIDNRFEFAPRIEAAQVDLYPDTLWTRDNADFEEWGWFGLGELEGDAGLVRASAGGFRRDGGRPGPSTFASPHARVRHERWDVRLGAVNTDRSLSADVTAARLEDRLYDDDREVGVDPAGTTHAVSEDLLGRVVWSPQWRLEDLLPGLPDGDLGLTVGGDSRWQWYRESFNGDDRPRRNRRTVSAFADMGLVLHGPRLTLRPGWRWQRNHDDFPPTPALPWLPEEQGAVHDQDSVSPSVGLSWEPVPDRVVVAAHWHETVRQPTWVELFGQPGGLVGNRNLQPEDVVGRDLGVRWSAPGAGTVLRVTAFEQITEQTILWYLAGFGMVKPSNAGRTRTRGLEVEGVVQRGPFDLALNVTRQDAEDRGGLDDINKGNALPFLPDWEVYADLRCQLGDWRPGVTYVHESAAFTDRYNDPGARTPVVNLINLSLAHTWRGGIWGEGREAVVTVEMINVTDRQNYDVENYPLPGRSLRLAVHWQ